MGYSIEENRSAPNGAKRAPRYLPPQLKYNADGTTKLLESGMEYTLKTPTLKDLYFAYKDSDVLKKKSAHTQEAYDSDLRKFFEFLELMPQITSPSQLTEAILIKYSDYLRFERGQRPRTVGRSLVGLKFFLNWAVGEGQLENKDLPSLIPIMRIRDIQPLPEIPKVEIERIQELALQRSSRDGALIALMRAGANSSEIANLQPEDIETDASGRIQVHLGRGRRERLVSFDGALSKAFSRIKEEREGKDKFFVNQRRGRSITRAGCWFILKGYASLVGRSDISPRSLRYLAVDSENSQDEIASALGIKTARAKIILERLERTRGQAGILYQDGDLPSGSVRT